MKKVVILMVLLCLFLFVGCGEAKEEFSVDGLEPSDQVEAIVNHYVEEKVFHGEVTDLQINPDADEVGKYVCLLYVDWDVENSSDNAKGVLQSYADELCYQLADNGNTSKFVVFFNAIQQGGLYKRGYDIKDGEPTVTDEIIQF